MPTCSTWPEDVRVVLGVILPLIFNQLFFFNFLNFSPFFIPRHTIVAGYYGFTLAIRLSVCPSVSRTSIRISFPDDNLSKHQWIFTKLCMCIDTVEICVEVLRPSQPNGVMSSAVSLPNHTFT